MTIHSLTGGLAGAQEQVRDFHMAMLGPGVAPDRPIPINVYNGELRCALIEEEAREFRSAWEAGDRMAMIDALCDLMYVTLGAAVQMGVPLAPFFEIVHEANMKKVGGSVREDGKQLKPLGWTAPDIVGVYRSLYGIDPGADPE